MKCDVVIPHYGDDKDLQDCLQSFVDDKTFNFDNFTPTQDMVIHVDKLSGGNSIVGNVYIMDNNSKNRGFSKGVNDGLQLSLSNPESEFVAIVNNDTVALENPFESMVDTLINNQDCSIVGPKVVSYDNQDHIVHAGGEQCFPNGVHRSGLVSLGHHSTRCNVKWLSFVVVVIRKKDLMRVGLLDENMFLICSDADWCYRSRWMGKKCLYEPSSVWAHKMGESSGATSEWSARTQKMDTFVFYKKWIAHGKAFQELDLDVMAH